MAGGLFDVDVLAGLEAEDGHGGVPVVGQGDGDGVDVFGGEDFAVVAVGCGGVAELLFGRGRQNLARMVESTSQTWVTRADGGVVLERGEVGVAATVEAEDGEVDAVVGADDLGVAFGGGTDGCACGGYGEAV